MTKSLNTDLSQHAAPAQRAAKRPRTWLVALLGFGAADLLVLNLWAVPNLITNTTTTDMRAAHSGDMPTPSEPSEPQHAEPAPSAEAAVQQAAEPSEPQHAEPAPSAEAAAQQAAEPSEPQHAEPAPSAEAAAQQGVEPSEPSEPAEQAAAPQNEQAEEAAPPAAPVRRVQAAPRAEAPPGGAPPAPAEIDVPDDPAVARAFAIRAAKRAVRVALQDRAAVSGSGPFAALTDDDQPLTQIFFSLGNFALGPNGKQTLERALAQLTGDERAILIVGAADPSGTEQVNSKLSDARAQSVAEWLLAHGVDAQRIQTRAIGHEGAVGSTLDRRVDIWLGGSR